jgi:hypothetical protein
MGVPFIPVYSEDVKLVVRALPAESFWGLVWKPFAPFSLSLWGTLLGTLGFSTLFIAYIERRSMEREGLRGTLAEASHITWFSFASMGMTLQPQSAGGRVFSIGLAFFLTVTGAAFTANTASFMVTQAGVEAPQNLQDVLDQGVRVCYPAGLSGNLGSAYPSLLTTGVACATHENPLPPVETLSAGGCEAALEVEVEMFGKWGKGELCEFHTVGDTLVQFMTGFYASEELYKWLSPAALNKIHDGTWAALDAQMKVSACAVDDSENEMGPSVLTPEHMIGNMCILAVCSIVALATEMGHHGARRLSRSLSSTDLSIPEGGSIERELGAGFEDVGSDIEADTSERHLATLSNVELIGRLNAHLAMLDNVRANLNSSIDSVDATRPSGTL